jgi:hypothetical protein
LLRALIGLVLGLGVGLVITVVVIAAKVGFFVNSPRAAHPLILVAFFVIPAVVGAWWGFRSSRRSGSN